jgi:hypothetical protein
MRLTIKPLDERLADFDRMRRSQHGPKLLLAQMPPRSTLADAKQLRERERVKQRGRQPCSFLDEELGIERG